ncbi:MAG: MATE family efflux transporter [Gemmatimonadales bacterium]|nr:MATE family efflux transporter [Gemmatimonadales bacterium]
MIPAEPAGEPLPLPPPYDPGITSGPLRPAILRLALPAVGTTLFQVLFNVTDTFWVGRTLGSDALAAVSLASYSVWALVSVGELVGVGLTAVAARRHGERNPIAAARATGTALVLALVLGAAVAGGIAGLPAVLRFMEARGEVAELARDFLVVQLLGAFLVYGYYVVAAAFRSAGDTRTPFALLGGSVLLNLVLDPLMILGWGPIPALGVYGAALATVLTRGLSFVVGLELLRRRGGIRLGFQPRVAATILRIGLPTMLTGFLFSVIYMVLVRVVGEFGPAGRMAHGADRRGAKLRARGHISPGSRGVGRSLQLGSRCDPRGLALPSHCGGGAVQHGIRDGTRGRPHRRGVHFMDHGRGRGPERDPNSARGDRGPGVRTGGRVVAPGAHRDGPGGGDDRALALGRMGEGQGVIGSAVPEALLVNGAHSAPCGNLSTCP